MRVISAPALYETNCANEVSVCYTLRRAHNLTSDNVSELQNLLKIAPREKTCVEICLPNHNSDEAGMTGLELQELIETVVKRFRCVQRFTLNIEYWSYAYMIMPKVALPISQLPSLLELTFISNNRSLNPSISNTALVHISTVLMAQRQLKKLHLEFADTSPEKRKFIKDDGFEQFAESFRTLDQLTHLNLNLTAWCSTQRSKFKQGNALCARFFANLFTGDRYYTVLQLNLSWWETIGYLPLIELFDQLARQRKLRTLALNLFRWSYYNDSFSLEALLRLSTCLPRLAPNLITLEISLFYLAAHKTQERQQQQQQQEDFQNNTERAAMRSLLNSDDIAQGPLILLANTLRPLMRLKKLDLQVLEYLPESALVMIRSALAEKPALTSLRIETKTPKDEQMYALGPLRQRTKARQNLIYAAAALKPRVGKRFRREILWEMLSTYC